MASRQVIRCFMLLMVVTAYSGQGVQARPEGRQDDVTAAHRTLTKRQGASAQTSSLPSSVSATAPGGWQGGGWKPNQPEPAEPSAPVTKSSPGLQRRNNGGGAAVVAGETNLNTDDAEAILNLSVDVADIAAGEVDPLRPSARTARRISGIPISEEEAAREQRRHRTRFVQDIHGSNVVTSVSSDFKNGTFVGNLYATENPWLQKYAPFYYPQNPLPTQLNHQPDGPPPVRLRQVHIGDTVLVPPKVEYSDQVLRTIHDAKLRSLPKPEEDVHLGGEEEEEVYEEEEAYEELGEYQEQPREEKEEYGAGMIEEVEEPPKYSSYEGGDGDNEGDYEWRPREAPGTQKPQSSEPTYNVNAAPAPDSGLSSRPGPPYQAPRPPPGFPFKQQSSVLVTHRSPSQHLGPQKSSTPAPHNSQRNPTKPSSAPKPSKRYNRNPIQPSPAPRPTVGFNKQRGPTKPNATPNPIVKHNSQAQPGRPTQSDGLGGGLFSPIRSQQRPSARPTPEHIQARPVFHPPSAPSRQQTVVPSQVQTLRPSPSPVSVRTFRPRYRTTPKSTPTQEIVEENGYSNKVKPDDVIPFSLSYGYEVVAPTTTPAPPPLSQYGKPKASTILGGSQAEPDSEGSDEFETLAGPVAPVVSARPLGPVDTSSSDASDGFGVPRPEHVIEDVPPQVGQTNAPVPPQLAREGYTRLRGNGNVPPPPVAPRREDSFEQTTASVGRPGYAAPKDADVLGSGENPLGERSQPLHTLNPVGDQGSAPGGEDSGQRASDTEELTPGGYMRPKQDDILSDDQAAGFVRSRYFPQSANVPNQSAERRATNGFGSPKEENLIRNDSGQEFGIRTTPIQFTAVTGDSESGTQNDFNRPKSADILGFNPNSLFGGKSAPTVPNQSQEQRSESPQTVRGYSPPKPGDLVEFNENSIVNDNDVISASGNSQPTRSILDYGPKGYSKPKDADVLNRGEKSETTNEFQISPIKFQTSEEPVSLRGEDTADVSTNKREKSKELAPPTAYSQPKTSDVVGGSDKGGLTGESYSEVRPLVIDQPLKPQEEEPEEPETTPDVSGFGPLRSDTVIEIGTGEDSSAQSQTDNNGFGAPRPQHIVSATETKPEDDRTRDVRQPSSDLYTVDDFLRSEDVSILGAFRAPGSSRGTSTKADGIDVTTQRARAAPKAAVARPAAASSEWNRRTDPGPFRAQAALLDAQFAGLFVDELPPPRRRQQSRRPVVRSRPGATRRRPVEPEFGPPFAILESRADHGWPIAQEDEPSRPLVESTPLKFGSAFAAEPLTPPGLLARRRSAVAPPRSRDGQPPSVASSRGRVRQRSTVVPRPRPRPTVAPRGGFSEQLSPFGDEFTAPFAAQAESRVSVTAVRPGVNPIPDWPKITGEW